MVRVVKIRSPIGILIKSKIETAHARVHRQTGKSNQSINQSSKQEEE
jgi:hypothetical protein